MGITGFYFAIVLVCNLSFQTCDYHLGKTGFQTKEECAQEVAKQMQRAADALQSQAGVNASRYTWHIFGICDLKPGRRTPA